MILVLVGTQPHNFIRLLKSIDKLSEELAIKEEIIVQLGSNNYQFNNKKIKVYEYLPNYNQLLNEAQLVICHGGVGIIMEALEKNKKIITIPRQQALKEHVDDHQQEICQKFNKEGYLKTCNTYEELKSTFQERENWELKKYHFNNQQFNKNLNKLLDNLE